MYCNNHFNGKYWAVLGQNYPDHQTIQITRVQIAEVPPYVQHHKSAIKCCILEHAQC
jgi:hypothetical protein